MFVRGRARIGHATLVSLAELSPRWKLALSPEVKSTSSAGEKS